MDNETPRSAGGVLRRRYIKDDQCRTAAVDRERLNADVAQMIYERRIAAGLTQKQLAELVETQQSVISRLEDADYEGHSLGMLHRVANALQQRICVQMTPADPEAEVIRFVFREILRALRKRHGLTVDELAEKLDADRKELAMIERQEGYRPNPLLLHKLSSFYGIPHRQMIELAGMVPDVEPGLREQASRFAAQSESFVKLTGEERRTLDEFVRFLKTGT